MKANKMRVLLECNDSKELLKYEIKEAVDNLNLVKSGKMKAKSAKDLYNKL